MRLTHLQAFCRIRTTFGRSSCQDLVVRLNLTWLACGIRFWILLHAAALLADSPFRAAAARNSTRPNLMLILSDQQRWDFDGQHFPMRMPNLQRLAAGAARFAETIGLIC